MEINMKKKDIVWLENGWTIMQEANAQEHILEISCLAENKSVVEIRKRHNDGEEEIIKSKIDDNYSLPMPLDEFSKLYIKDMISFK